MAFLGTVHHADSAMDVLIALTTATARLTFRRPGVRTGMLFFTTLAANFLWHPREFLQVSLYVGVFAALLLVTPALWRVAELARYATVVGTLMLAAVVFLGLSTTLVPKESHGYPELQIKKKALEYACLRENILGHAQHVQLSVSPGALQPGDAR